jgi:hypothetical protein
MYFNGCYTGAFDHDLLNTLILLSHVDVVYVLEKKYFVHTLADKNSTTINKLT